MSSYNLDWLVSWSIEILESFVIQLSLSIVFVLKTAIGYLSLLILFFSLIFLFLSLIIFSLAEESPTLIKLKSTLYETT